MHTSSSTDVNELYIWNELLYYVQVDILPIMSTNIKEEFSNKWLLICWAAAAWESILTLNGHGEPRAEQQWVNQRHCQS